MEIVFALPSSKTKNTEEEPLNWEYAIAKHFFELGLFSTLTWQDIRLIAEIGNDFMNSEESDNIELTDEAYYSAILDKVREQGRDAKTSWSENRKARGE